MELTINTIIQRNEQVLTSDIDGEKVMMSVENSEYYGLGVSGSYIWDQLKFAISINELIDRVILRFNVEKGQCIQDIIPFLENLLEKHLIQIVTN